MRGIEFHRRRPKGSPLRWILLQGAAIGGDASVLDERAKRLAAEALLALGGVLDAAALEVEVSGGSHLGVDGRIVLGLQLPPNVFDKAVMQLGSLEHVGGGSSLDGRFVGRLLEQYGGSGSSDGRHGSGFVGCAFGAGLL